MSSENCSRCTAIRSCTTSRTCSMQRGGAYYSEAAINLLCGLFGDSTDVQVVDVRNNGIIPELPADAVIEVPAHVGPGGAEPLPVPALPRPPGGSDRAHRARTSR